MRELHKTRAKRSVDISFGYQSENQIYEMVFSSDCAANKAWGQVWLSWPDTYWNESRKYLTIKQYLSRCRCKYKCQLQSLHVPAQDVGHLDCEHRLADADQRQAQDQVRLGVLHQVTTCTHYNCLYISIYNHTSGSWSWTNPGLWRESLRTGRGRITTTRTRTTEFSPTRAWKVSQSRFETKARKNNNVYTLHSQTCDECDEEFCHGSCRLFEYEHHQVTRYRYRV